MPTKPPTNKGTKISFPGDRKRQSAQPQEEAPTPENRNDVHGAPKPKLPSSTETNLVSEDKGKEREGLKTRTRSAEGQRGRNPSPPPSSVSDRIPANRQKEPLPDQAPGKPKPTPPSPSKSTKTFKRIRAISHVLEEQEQQDPFAPKPQLTSPPSDDDASATDAAGYKVLPTSKPAAKSSKKAKATIPEPFGKPKPAKCVKVKVSQPQFDAASASDQEHMAVVTSDSESENRTAPAGKPKKRRNAASTSCKPPSSGEAETSESEMEQPPRKKFPVKTVFERLRERIQARGAAAAAKPSAKPASSGESHQDGNHHPNSRKNDEQPCRWAQKSSLQPPSTADRATLEKTAAQVTESGAHSTAAYTFSNKLNVHQSSADGACFFTSASESLNHILHNDSCAFGLNLSPNLSRSVQALVDCQSMRATLCDYMEEHMDTIFENLGFLSPRQTIQRDYIDDGQLVGNPVKAQEDQVITSIPSYVTAMRHPASSGDEIMFVMLSELLNLRCVVFELYSDTEDNVMFVSTNLDICPKQPWFPKTPMSTQRHSSDMAIIMVKNGDHFDWAHLISDNCSSGGSDNHCVIAGQEEIEGFTTLPLVSRSRQAPTPSTTKSSTTEPAGGKAYALPNPLLLSIAVQRRQRQQVVDTLTDDHDVPPQDAEAVVALFERSGVHAKLKFLPEILRIWSAIAPGDDPLADKPPATIAAPSRHVAANALKRANSLREAMDAAVEGLSNASENPNKEEAQLREGAANAVRIISKCSHARAVDRVAYHLQFTNNHGEAVMAAVKELSGQQPNYVPPPAPKAAHYFDENGLSFVERHLGAGTREMTVEELAKAEADLVQAARTGELMPIVPINLNRYWQHHLEAAAATPRGSLTAQQHQRIIRTAASTALHHEACDAATAACHHSLSDQAIAQHQRPAASTAAPTQPPATTAHSSTQPFAAPQTAPLPPAPAPAPTFASAAGYVTPGPTYDAEQSKYKSHNSPAVRMAAAREDQAQSARAAATTVVVMANSGSKPMQWKVGEEKDGKGFYLKTYMAVQQSWEQHNKSEEVHGYRTFRSTIHCTMVPIICAELALSRADWDKIQDAELITRLDKILQPSGPVDFLIKLRTIKFNHADTKTNMVHRYRAFAEPFLQLLSEAQDAGCPINNESIKLAFKTALQDNQLLLMWFQEERWTTAVSAHQRIAAHLKAFDQHNTLQLMSSNQSPQIAGPAPAIPAVAAAAPVPVPVPAPAPIVVPAPAAAPAPPAPVRQHYTPEQRQAYQQQQQQQRQDRLLNQQAVLVNMVGQAINGALQAQQAPPPAPAPYYAAPAPAPAAAHVVQAVYHPAAPAYSPAPAPQAQVNAFYPAPRPSPPAAAAAAQAAPYVHPGLDARGPNWHPATIPALKCRYNPCTSTFCQGCGEHGHSMQDCKKRGKHANWNAFGYYAEQRPGQGPLVYDGTPYRQAAPLAPQQFQPPQQAHQVPPPPPRAHVAEAAAQPFPIPYSLNSQHSTRSYTPVTRSNVAVQAAESSTTSEVPPTVPQN